MADEQAMTLNEGARALAGFQPEQEQSPLTVDEAARHFDGEPEAAGGDALTLDQGAAALSELIGGQTQVIEQPSPAVSAADVGTHERELMDETAAENRVAELANNLDAITQAISALDAAMWQCRSTLTKQFEDALTVEGAQRLSVADPHRHAQFLQVFDRMQEGMAAHGKLQQAREHISREAFEIFARREDRKLNQTMPELRISQNRQRAAEQVGAMLNDLGIFDEAQQLLASSPTARDHRVQQILLLAARQHAQIARKKPGNKRSADTALSMQQGGQMLGGMLA